MLEKVGIENCDVMKLHTFRRIETLKCLVYITKHYIGDSIKYLTPFNSLGQRCTCCFNRLPCLKFYIHYTIEINDGLQPH